MGFISEIFGYVLNFLYGIFNNYGIAIIVFSVLLKNNFNTNNNKTAKSIKEEC